MPLFHNPKIEPGEIANIYEGRKVADRNYDECRGCPVKGNRKVWTFRGSHDAMLCFIGMNPGTKEKKYGYPFVGPAGLKFDERVLDGLDIELWDRRRIGENDIWLGGDFYLTNVVKCFTANNENPSQSAINHCWNHLEPELAGRSIIVPMGNLAQKAVRRNYNGPAMIIDMIHPAAACRRGIFDARLIDHTQRLNKELR